MTRSLPLLALAVLVGGGVAAQESPAPPATEQSPASARDSTVADTTDTSWDSTVADTTEAPLPAHAARGPFQGDRSFTFTDENDVFDFKGDASDDAYTQGMRLAWTLDYWPRSLRARPSRPGSLRHEFLPVRSCSLEPGVLSNLLRNVWPCGTITFGFGQTIYTPTDLRETERILTDRPYAGWLFVFGGVRVNHERHAWGLDTYLGTLGPPSLAQDTQTLAHWTFAHVATQPQGWDHQLRSGLYANAVARWDYRPPSLERCRGKCGEGNTGRYFDVIAPQVQVNTGLLMNSVAARATVRLGHNIPRPWGEDQIPIKIDSEPIYRPPPRLSAFVALTGEYRQVFSNAFIDGGHADGGADGWRRNRLVTATNSVYEVTASVSVRFGKLPRLTYHQIYRSPEFVGRDGRAGRSDWFGVFSLTWDALR